MKQSFGNSGCKDEMMMKRTLEVKLVNLLNCHLPLSFLISNSVVSLKTKALLFLNECDQQYVCFQMAGLRLTKLKTENSSIKPVTVFRGILELN